MDTRLSSRQNSLSIGIIYADMISAAVASQMAHRLQRTVGKADLRIQFCSFRQLETGTAEAGLPVVWAVDLLLVASLDSWLPVHVQRWVEAWLAQDRGQRTALGALMYTPQGPSYHLLHKLCRKHDVDFLECTKMSSAGSRVERTGRNHGRRAVSPRRPELPTSLRSVE